MAINSKCCVTENNKLYLQPSSVTQQNQKYEIFDLEWKAHPKAKSYALVMIDYEASRVVGQPFVHFAACNLTKNSFLKGENLTNLSWVQGVNSTCPGINEQQNGVLVECIPAGFRAKSFEDAIGYFPPMPPDKKHLYTLRVYALDVEKLPLKNGFFLGDLNREMLDHVLEVQTLNFWYDPKRQG